MKKSRGIRLLILLLTGFVVWFQTTTKTAAQPSASTQATKSASPGQDAVANPANYAADYALIHHVEWGELHIRPTTPPSAPYAFDYTVFLRTIVEAPVKFRVDVRRILDDGSLSANSSYTALQTIPADQRQYRFEAAQHLPAGVYLVRITQLGGIISYQALLHVDLGAGSPGTGVIFTPITDIAIDNESAEPTPPPSNPPPSEGEGVSAALRATTASRISTIRAGNRFYINATTEGLVTTDASWTLDVTFRLSRITTNGLQTVWSDVRKPLLPRNRRHTFKFYATQTGVQGGQALSPGHYRLTAVRVGTATTPVQQTVSVEFDIN